MTSDTPTARVNMPRRKGGREEVMDDIEAELNVAESKAIDALARYKFQMFGYWAAPCSTAKPTCLRRATRRRSTR